VQGGTVYLCSTLSGRVLRRCVGSSEEGGSPVLVFSPDGKWLATAGPENSVALWEVSTGLQKGELKGHRGPVKHLAFAPGGKSLYSASDDCTVMIWDVAEALKPRPLEEEAPALVRAAEDLWADLASDDGAKAEQASREFAASPAVAVRFLKAQLKPEAAVESARLAKWIEELGSETFEVREAAMRALEQANEQAAGALRAAKERPGSKERGRRIEQLLEKLDRPGMRGEQARAVRAVEILEQLRSLEAREVLAGLAKGAADARLTREARAALTRLGP
jgi:hypothetical protein